MYKKETVVINASGLHARPASDFVKEAKKFEAKINIRKTGGADEAVNAKSIMRLLSAGISKGTRVEISAEGTDETAAVDALAALVEGGFGEL